MGPMSGQLSDLPSAQGALGRASGSTGGGTGPAGDHAGTTSRTSALGMSRQVKRFSVYLVVGMAAFSRLDLTRITS